MRPGDKLASYRVLGDALAPLLDLSWSLDIVGDGPARGAVEQMLAPLGARVRYRGALPGGEVAAALAESDLFVWPAINEAFGMALLEAQASGLPVVAGASGGVAGIVAAGETGLLTPPGDAAAFAAAVRRLLVRRPDAGTDGCGGAGQGGASARIAGGIGRTGGGAGATWRGAGSVTGSVLFHVQYLLGIGHLQRSLRIAGALADLGVTVTLVSGGEPVALPRHPAIRLVQLPPIGARDASFQLFDGAGGPLDDAYRAVRRAALLEAFAEAKPDVVVIEGFPFARHAFRFELEPLIAAARARTPRSRVVCSVRDIVILRDDPKRFRDIVNHVRRDFDAVLVHGDPTLVPLEASFPAAPEIADRLLYTGYVGPAAPSDTEDGDGCRSSSRRAVARPG